MKKTQNRKPRTENRGPKISYFSLRSSVFGLRSSVFGLLCLCVFRSFLFAAQLPPPTPIVPSTGSFIQTTPVRFDWTDVTGGTSYYIVVDNSPDLTLPEISSYVTNSGYYSTQNLEPGTYWWQLKTWDGTEWGPVIASTPTFTVDTSSAVYTNFLADRKDGSWIGPAQWTDKSSPTVKINVQDVTSGLRAGQAPLPVSSGTALMIRFDEPDTFLPVEYSGYNSLFTHCDCTGTRINSLPGFGSALSFPDGGQYLTIQHSTNFDFTGLNGLTVEAWVKPPTLAGTHSIIEKHNISVNEGGFILRQENNAIYFLMYFPGIGDVPAMGLFDNGADTWYHLAGTYDRQYVRIYVNGRLAGQTPATFAIPSTSNPLVLASKGDQIGVYQFFGAIDEVRILKRAITTEEIALDYNSAAIKYSTDAGSNWTIDVSTTMVSANWSHGSVALEVSSSSAGLPFTESGTKNLVKFLTMDTAGNASESSSYSVKVDTTPPSPDPPVWLAPVISTSSLTWEILTATDVTSGLDALAYTFNGGTTWVTSATTTFTTLTPNTLYPATAAVRDVAGNITTITSSSAYTLANPPLALTRTLTGDTAVQLDWNANNNPTNTCYTVYRSTDNFILSVSTIVTLTDNLTLPSYTDSSIWTGATFYYKIGAGNAVGIETAYSNTVNINLPLGSPAGFSGTAISTGAILWTWLDSPGTESGYRVFAATGGASLSGNLPPGTTYWIETSLSPNTQYSRYVEVFSLNSATISAIVALYTAANLPLTLTATAINYSQVDLIWLPGSGGNAKYAIQRSSDGANYSDIKVSGDNYTATNFSDTGLRGATLYYYRIAGYNAAGTVTAFTAPVSAQTPYKNLLPPRNLTAIPVANRQIKLEWLPSLSTDVNHYHIYYSTDEPSLSTYQDTVSLLSLPWTTLSWTSPVLSSGFVYKFIVRGSDDYENEDPNKIYVMAEPVNVVSNVAAHVKHPPGGSRVKGNRFMISADLHNYTYESANDKANYGYVGSVLFQYRKQGDQVWSNIPSVSPTHPNPDSTYPWFIHWDMSALTNGQAYEARAVASYFTGIQDAAPPATTIFYESTEPDIEMNDVSDAKTFLSQKVGAEYHTKLEAGYPDSNQIVSLEIPELSITAKTDKITVKLDPSNAPPPTGKLKRAGSACEIYLASGQKYLDNGVSLTKLIIPYKDDNNDGKEDSSGAPVQSLGIYSYNENIGIWRKEDAWTIDRTAKTITANISHFSYFGVFASPQDNLDSAHVFPNPFQPDSGLGHTVINFTNLTGQARIRIFNIAGELVFETESATTGGNITWNGLNGNGDPVASGIYFYVITNDENQTQKGKLAIIR